MNWITLEQDLQEALRRITARELDGLNGEETKAFIGVADLCEAIVDEVSAAKEEQEKQQ